MSLSRYKNQQNSIQGEKVIKVQIKFYKICPPLSNSYNNTY